MLEVYPIQDKKEQERICKLCGIEYDVEKLAYSAYVSGELMGASQFAIHGSAGYIYDLENCKNINNTDILFVMGRAALNFIDLCGVKNAYFEGNTEGREELIKSIGFKLTEDNRWFIDLNGFFDSPCKCH